MTVTKASVAVLAAGSLVLLAGCSPSLVQTDPALPPGFLDARVPASDLNAYLYVSQEQPTTIPLRLLANEDALPAGSPTNIQVEHLATFMGPDLEAFGATLGFGDEADARFVWQQVEGPLKEAVTGQQKGADIRLVRGSTPWAQSLQGALARGDANSFPEGHPEVWELMRLLPESPPGKPVAAGFLKPTKLVIDALASRAGLSLGNLSQAMGTVNIENVAFAAYSNRPLEIPTDVTPEYIREHNVGAIYVARSSYPGFILSFFLNNFSGRVDLEKVTIGDETVLYRAFNDVHLLVKAIGNTIFFTMAPERGFAEELMASVLDVQTG